MSGYSLMPGDAPRSSGQFRMPGAKSMRVIAGSLAAIAVAVGLTVYTGGKADSAQKALNDAQADEQIITQRTQRLQKELGDLQGAGGTARLTLIKGLLDARMDWKEVLLAFSESAPSGLKLDQLSATAPTGTGDDSGLQIAGQAGTEGDLTQFLNSLKRKRAVIDEVGLRSVTKDEEGSGVRFSANVTLKAPAAPPGGVDPAAAAATPPTTTTP